MPFRCARKPNDSRTWIALVLSLGLLVCVLAVGYFGASGETPPHTSLIVTLAIVSAGALAFCVRGLLNPYKVELVVEEDLIRWGRSDKPERQQRLQISRIVRVMHDSSDSAVIADVGTALPRDLGAEVLVRAEDRAALISYLRRTYPSLRIDAR